VELYLNYPNTPSWRGAQLKHRGNFTLHLKDFTRTDTQVVPLFDSTLKVVNFYINGVKMQPFMT